MSSDVIGEYGDVIEEICKDRRPSGWQWPVSRTDDYQEEFKMRGDLREHYSYGLPSEQAMDVLSDESPIVEIGAGNGYWAHLAQQRGVDIVPTDKNPKSDQWTDVENIHHVDAMDKYDDRTVLLVWPQMESYAAEVANIVKPGQHLIYVGEPSGGCCATGQFFTRLRKDFEKVCSIDIPQFYSLSDSLRVYERK